MDNMAFNFALDFQEINHKGGEFTHNLQSLMGEKLEYINISKSQGQTIAFIDNSACEFQGHNIKLIDNLENKIGS